MTFPTVFDAEYPPLVEPIRKRTQPRDLSSKTEKASAEAYASAQEAGRLCPMPCRKPTCKWHHADIL